MQRLLEMDARIEVKDHYGWTPLILAILENRVDVMQLLLSRKANLYVKTNDGKTVTHFAAGQIDHKIVDKA